jgi:hypothetical protein
MMPTQQGDTALIPVSKLRVRRVKDVELGHLVALPHRNETLLGIVVEAPPESKADRLVLALAVDMSEPHKVPYVLPSSAPEQCFDFGGPATFLWPPIVSRIHPRWHAGLQTGHLAVTENVVAINGCFGRHQTRYAYWDVQSGRMVWDKYTMFLTEWQLRAPDSGEDLLLNFPADFRSTRPTAVNPVPVLEMELQHAMPAG